MNYIDADLGSFFSGLDEVQVTFGGVTQLGHFNTPEAPFDTGPAGGVESQRIAVDLPADAFTPMPLPRQTITVTSSLFGTMTYAVESRKLGEDGRIMTLGLGR